MAPRDRDESPARVQPRKSLGQHFLVDENILGVIGRLAELDPADVVLEVGPGMGVLTRFLASRVGFVQAVEVDTRLAPYLDEIPNVELWWEDALSLDMRRLAPTPTKLVANLPYNIATPLVIETLYAEHISLWCVMVQREVAERFFAVPRTKSYGAVSVLIQLAAERAGLHPVSRDVFRPRPKVDSAVVAFRRTGPPAPSAVRRVVDAGFAHRRKTLANSLALTGIAARERVVDALEALGHPPAVRAEALAPAEFVELTEKLS